MAPRYFASEFPNDNPEMHAGTVWVVRTPCAPPEAELVLEETRPIALGAAAPTTRMPLVASAPEVTQELSMRRARDVDTSARGETTIEAWLTEEADDAGPSEDSVRDVAAALDEAIREAPLPKAPVETHAQAEEEAAAEIKTVAAPMDQFDAVFAASPIDLTPVDPPAVEAPEPPELSVSPGLPAATALHSGIAPASHEIEDVVVPPDGAAPTIAADESHVRLTEKAEVADAAPESEPEVAQATADIEPETTPEEIEPAPPEVAAGALATEAEAEAELEPAAAGEASPSEAMQVSEAPQASEATQVSEAPPVDPFRALIDVLASVAAGAGVPIDADALHNLLDGGSADDAAFSGIAVAALCEGGLASYDGDRVVLSAAYAATARAWRSVLRDEEADFAACGSRMLDEWAADLVARLVGSPAKMDAFRRELRGRGVAAFGLLAAA